MRDTFEQSGADHFDAHRLDLHDDVLVRLLADHEGIGPDLDEAVLLVESPGAVIVGVDGKVQVLHARRLGFGERPIHQLARRASPAPFVEHVELAKLDPRTVGVDGKFGRPELHEADRLAIRFR